LELEADMKASSAVVLKTIIDEARYLATIVYLSPFAYIWGQLRFCITNRLQHPFVVVIFALDHEKNSRH
jgi:hypothetical protein